LVDAFDDPTAASDLNFFASYYGLPTPTFQVIKDGAAYGYSGCTTPPPNQGWALEESLDIEWAFAMAETAKIYLVEACSDSFADLTHAELVAGSLVKAAGGGDISNSWGGGEFPGETSYDTYFFKTCLTGDSSCSTGYWDRIVYFASAGDNGCGAQWPSSSPWVVSAGGTTINRDQTTHNFTSESCWSGSGGGVSSVETWGSAFPTGMGPWVNFQYSQFGQTARQTPDIAADADPASGVGVYCNSCGGGPWFQVGGTSLASPLLAGVVNIAGNKLGQAPHGSSGFYTNEQNAFMYSELFTVATKSAHFYDVSQGSNGAGCGATTGYDRCTGIGSPLGYSGH
jgi:subtilase family serine protease